MAAPIRELRLGLGAPVRIGARGSQSLGGRRTAENYNLKMAAPITKLPYGADAAVHDPLEAAVQPRNSVKSGRPVPEIPFRQGASGSEGAVPDPTIGILPYRLGITVQTWRHPCGSFRTDRSLASRSLPRRPPCTRGVEGRPGRPGPETGVCTSASALGGAASAKSDAQPVPYRRGLRRGPGRRRRRALPGQRARVPRSSLNTAQRRSLGGGRFTLAATQNQSARPSPDAAHTAEADPRDGEFFSPRPARTGRRNFFARPKAFLSSRGIICGPGRATEFVGRRSSFRESFVPRIFFRAS